MLFTTEVQLSIDKYSGTAKESTVGAARNTNILVPHSQRSYTIICLKYIFVCSLPSFSNTFQINQKTPHNSPLSRKDCCEVEIFRHILSLVGFQTLDIGG